MRKCICAVMLMVMFVSVMPSLASDYDYVVIDMPIGAQNGSNVIWVRWSGSSRGLAYMAPDSGYIYYGKSPGGNDLSSYNYKITPWKDENGVIQDNIHTTSPILKRGIAFRPIEQTAMGPGIYYCVVALPLENDTLMSNEFQVIVESPNSAEIISPSGNTSELTPVFTWEPNAGVPYYHVILSDEPIKINNTNSDEIDLQGVSIVWQAITPNTQITYGAPDPSGIITAEPPPLSPGRQYTWVVLNNFGNHPVFSSMKLGSIGEFAITGELLKKPHCLSPVNKELNSINDSIITFTWDNLDSKANTYKVYAYVGSDFEGIGAQIIVWQTEVVANDTATQMSVDVNAKSVFTTNKYIWKVVAIDDRGAGTTGDTAGFFYDAPSGTIQILTRENVKVSETVNEVVKIGLAEIKLQVLDGSMENPLFFYTDESGYLSRERPVGTYTITAIKDGFENQTRTITVEKNKKAEVTFYLERPEASIYGKIVDQAGKGINRVSIKGISDRNDSVFAQSDASGNFVLNCSEADWVLSANISGYKSYTSKKVRISSGQKYGFGSITLEKNPLTLSGTVKNSSGLAILAASVKVYRDEVLVGEVPSTPQSGTYSFSLASGNYVIKCEKSGFGFYSAPINLIASTQHNISLKPGASLIMGSIYGKSWSNGKYVYAPITNANVAFVDTLTKDTVTVTTDAIYGDYKVSLIGDRAYWVISKASGYINSSTPRIIVTKAKTNFNFSDTLHSLAMVSGTIVTNEGKNASGVKVSFVKVLQNQVLGSGISTPNGYFEIKNLNDGIYAVKVGKVGYVTKSIDHDTIEIVEGRPNYEKINIVVEQGSKSVIVLLNNNQGASLKFREPFLKDIKIGDTLNNVGDGEYMVSVDADVDSLIDLSEHWFTVADTETIHTETVALPLSHVSVDTLIPNLGKVKIGIKSLVPCDSVEIYFKNSESIEYTCEKNKNSSTEYSFDVIPPKDGSLMQYYFKAYIKSDVYGSDKEVYETFIVSDTTILTYTEIYPFSNDTLIFPSSYQASFSFRGYYSSSYIQDTSIDVSGITWEIENSQKCKLLQSTGLNVSVKMGKDSTTTPVILTAKIDTSKIPLKKNLSSSIQVAFNVSGATLSKITVNRTDGATPNPITSSVTDMAEFTAVGTDRNGNETRILPKWSILPQSAGKITQYGVFRPNETFVGNVQIFAENGSLTGEYTYNGKGLNVQYMIRCSEKEETVSNGRGCSITFPSNIVPANEYGVLSMATESIVNRIMIGKGNEIVVDSTLIDINEMNNVRFKLGSDSIRLTMAIPSHLQKSALNGKRKMNIAFWNEDSLKWSVLNSKIADDKKTIEVGLTHFSKYAIISQDGSSSYLDVKPNPFSPFVKQADLSKVNCVGTCIKFHVESSTNSLNEILLRIYNITGDVVWSLSIQNARSTPYEVWWDGRTSSRENTIASPSSEIILPQGKKMCRNGRYFVVLTAKEANGKQRQMKKQIVLMK